MSFATKNIQKISNNKEKKSKKKSKKISPPKTAVHDSVFRGNENDTLKLLSEGFDVNYQDEHGETPLHVAVSEAHTNLVRLLLQNKADVNCISKRCTRPIHIATNYGYYDIFKLLLEYHADVNVQNYVFETPLHIAATKGRENFVKDLLENGANVNSTQRRYLNTPLHLAIYFKKINIAELLVKNNCNINAVNDKGDTPLHFVNCKESASFLLGLEADINILNCKDETLATIYDSRFVWSPVHVILLKHFEKWKLLGYHINKENQQSYESIKSKFYKYVRESLIREDYERYIEQCKSEIHKLKRMKISHYTNLYDFLFKDHNELALMTINDFVLSHWENGEFKNEFPIYGHLLKLQFERGLTRKPLLESAKQKLNEITGLELPDLCGEGILKFLCKKNLSKLESVNIIRKTHYGRVNVIV